MGRRAVLWIVNCLLSSLVFTLSVHFSSVTQSCLTLQPHEPQHARPPCPSPTPRVHPNPCQLCWWCHPTISSSVVPFSSCPQSLLASGSFPMSQLFAWSGQSTGVSTLASVLPKKSQGWSSEWTDWISLQSKGLSRVFSNTTVQNVVLLIHKKEWNNAICRNMDGPRNYHSKWSKSERERQIPYGLIYMWKLKRWFKWTYLQGRNTLTDFKNTFMATKVETWGDE